MEAANRAAFGSASISAREASYSRPTVAEALGFNLLLFGQVVTLLVVLLLCGALAVTAYCVPLSPTAALALPATGSAVLAPHAPSVCLPSMQTLLASNLYAVPALALVCAST